MKKSKIEFGSLLAYSPRGNSKKQKKSRTVMRLVKCNRILTSGISMADYVARNIKEELTNYPFSNYFNRDVVLVPTPSSALMKKGTLWMSQCITLALDNAGLGKNIECLKRNKAVKKSATSVASDRPKTLDHYKSMIVTNLLDEPREIIVVDDIITRGATTLGAVNRLTDAFPSANIRVFAVIRTVSNPDEFSEILDPCVGTVKLEAWGTRRNP